MKTSGPKFWLPLLGIITILVAIVASGIGAVFVSPIRVMSTVLGLDSGNHVFILENYRFPRVVLALLVGAGLGVSGAILQGVIRNPLASPDVIGITKGAGLAAAMIIILIPNSPVFALPLAAFVGAGMVTLFLYIFAYKQGVNPSTLALVGIAIGAVCQAGIQFLMVKFPVEINAALVWLTGSIWGNDWNDVALLAPFIVILVPLSIMVAIKLDVLSLGDEVAQGLGESVKRTRILLLCLSVALAGASVAVVGSLGFIGLIAPHIARQLVGNRSKILLPASALTGMIIVLLADALGRGVAPPVEVPAGIFTAVIGAPYFLYLLRRIKVKG
ncbi:FecCD family ABC transporter permease [Salinibacillus xinjiangensis]|uniref:Iron chelate uptake ABC transporter family permease subunit n=1 Tax=Salinibacillus xinjiangensis TaxID=1229268 RepID=A0A6G1X7Q5_9BACI|nr:iron chelate uptake ABC transporter family permease subunit [Salinibacillus xinjiangensis]MRG86838.1 iron chelate uptake ABC transporter family permease subunit [Salinibacillus xinjiangensis]